VTVHLRDIRDAADAIAGRVVRTPCTRSQTLSEITGAKVVLKFENHQFTASFKDRGALVRLLALTPEERSAGVIAMSAGNHAQAVAYHAQKLNIPATIVMPRRTPNVKVERTRAFGAEVILHGDGLDEAHRHTQALARQRSLPLIHPYDDERVIAGQGTIALEMLEAFADLEVLVIPVGGGGLIAGNATAAKALRPELEIVGVEAERFPAMLQALRGDPIQCGTTTIAEGIAVKEPGRYTLPVIRNLVDEILLVDEVELEAAVLLLLEVEKTVVEGAGAAGLAALLQHRGRAWCVCASASRTCRARSPR
jgi:threonine dehydratase